MTIIRMIFPLTLAVILFLTGCTFNPFVSRHHETGDPAGLLIGAGGAAGTVALLGGTKPIILLAGLGGGAIGYYSTTLRYAASGIKAHGGAVNELGEYVRIEVPTDNFFEVNTAHFLPQSAAVLDSIAMVLKRYPCHHVLVAVHTNGYASRAFEYQLSLARAKKVAFYLSYLGISGYPTEGNHYQQLAYIGVANQLPIANEILLKGIRENSRIQIISYPVDLALKHVKEEVN